MRRAFAFLAFALAAALSSRFAQADSPPTNATPVSTLPASEAPSASHAPASDASPSKANASAPVAASTPTKLPEPVADAKPLPAWRFAAMLGVVSLPRPLSLEVLAKLERPTNRHEDFLAFGPRIEYLPNGIAKFDTTNLSWFQVGAEARWFPWRFLFAGAGMGWQFSRADSVNYGSKVEYITRSGFVSPEIGAMYTFRSGLTIGGELGATIPFAPTTDLYSDGTTDGNARKVAKTFGMFVMPYLSVFRIGYTL